MLTRLLILGAAMVLTTAALAAVLLNGGETDGVATGESAVASSVVQVPDDIGVAGDQDVALTWEWPDIARTDAGMGRVGAVVSSEGEGVGGTWVSQVATASPTLSPTEVTATAVAGATATAVARPTRQAEIHATRDAMATQIAQGTMVPTPTLPMRPTTTAIPTVVVVTATPPQQVGGGPVCNTPWGALSGYCGQYYNNQ